MRILPHYFTCKYRNYDYLMKLDFLMYGEKQNRLKKKFIQKFFLKEKNLTLSFFKPY
jgi:hypothetical protein